MPLLFTLNTIGNLFSTNKLEQAIFTPLTFIGAILCIIMAMNKSKKNEQKN